MPADIFGQRFLGRREPAWHALGTTFGQDEVLSVTEAFERAKMLYRFEKWPLTAAPHDNQWAAQQLEQVAIMREPTEDDPQWRHISTVQPDFGVIQNSDLAKSLDKLAQRWPVETVGALKQGATTFVTLATGHTQVKGDQLDRYVLVSDGKAGDHALRIATVDIRVVCANTLEAAWASKNGGLRIAFPHREDVADDLKFAVELFEQIEAAQRRQLQAFEVLAATRIDRADAAKVITAAYRVPEPPKKLALLQQLLERAGFLPASAQEMLVEEQRQYDLAADRYKALGNAGLELYDTLCAGSPQIAGTAWAAYNAVAELADNRWGTTLETAAVATLFGDRAQERARAFRACWKLAGDPALN